MEFLEGTGNCRRLVREEKYMGRLMDNRIGIVERARTSIILACDGGDTESELRISE
jgi:hypothetical protein